MGETSAANARARQLAPGTDETRARSGSYIKHFAPPIVVAGLALIVDQWSKTFVAAYINARGGPKSLLHGKVLIDLVHNTGASPGALPAQAILFIVIAVAGVTALIVSCRLASVPLALRLGLGLILGGALGNLTDRVRLGYVVDFIDLRWWPAFNLADGSVVVGVVTVVIALMVLGERKVEGE
jgi:signal peptidase II